MDFLHDGDPDLDLDRPLGPAELRRAREARRPNLDRDRVLLEMLGRLNLCSGETKARHYDHEVKGLT